MNNLELAKSSYVSAGKEGRVLSANAHQLISILLEELLNLLDEIHVIKSRGASQPVTDQKMMVFTILDSLSLSLDMEKGGDLAQSLHLIYRQVRQLVESEHPSNQAKNAQSAHHIISEISSAWSAIG